MGMPCHWRLLGIINRSIYSVLLSCAISLITTSVTSVTEQGSSVKFALVSSVHRLVKDPAVVLPAGLIQFS